MFVENAVAEFYDVVRGHKVLLLVGCDVDALCACKILQFLFHCDNVLYTMIGVHGREALLRAYDEHRSQVRYVVTLNCGATADLVELLQPPEEVVFFVADTHRPVNVYNVYSESQVRLLMSAEDCEGIPAYADIFRDDEDENSDGEDREAALIRRRELRLWEENRSRLLFDYSQTSYFGEPSALVMFNLAWKMSRDDRDLLWWAIVGLTEQLVLQKRDENQYMLAAASMQRHVLRHSRDEDAIKITFDKELNLNLYRHWTLYDSISHSQYTASRFRLWSQKGHKKKLEFLADIGLPLTQCKQRFSSMDMEFRNNAVSWMEGVAEKYDLDRITYGAFVSQMGYKGKFSAADVVLATHAFLESLDREKSVSDRFQDALDALKKGEAGRLRKGIELAKARLCAVFRQVQMFIDMKLVVNAGPYLYAIVNNATHDQRYFCRPECLLTLAHFTLSAYCANTKERTKNRRAVTQLPLLLFAQDEEHPERCLVVGVPPLAESSRRNFLGKAFEQAAEQARVRASQDLFSEQFVYINGSDQGKFLSTLFLLLN